MNAAPIPPPFDDDLLQRCISCGFCLPACPTYDATHDEASSPRGRISLMRALQDGTISPFDSSSREQASQCLGCRACEPVCPAGVEYGQLLEQWRDVTWKGTRRPAITRPLTAFARSRILIRLGGKIRGAAPARGAGTPAATTKITLLLGCFERILFPGVSRAAARAFPDIAVDHGQGCCGALHAHNGDTATGEALARKVADDLTGVIVTTSGGCAAHLASVLGRDRVVEISELAHSRNNEPTSPLLPATSNKPRTRIITPLRKSDAPARRLRLTLQDSCHLRNGLGVYREPRELLKQYGDYVELPSASVCCGAAGSYSLVQRRLSTGILASKLDEIEAANVDIVVTVNPGCLRQLTIGLRRRRSRVKVVHIAEILANWPHNPIRKGAHPQETR